MPGRTNRNAHETRRVKPRTAKPLSVGERQPEVVISNAPDVAPATAVIQPVEYPIPAPYWEQA
jgi:hypothetical protein